MARVTMTAIRVKFQQVALEILLKSTEGKPSSCSCSSLIRLYKQTVKTIIQLIQIFKKVKTCAEKFGMRPQEALWMNAIMAMKVTIPVARCVATGTEHLQCEYDYI